MAQRTSSDPADAAPSGDSIAAPAPPARRSFVARTSKVKMDPAAAARQGRAVSLAWGVLRDSGKVMTFLNSHQPALDARPIDLAVASADGLARVEQFIASGAIAEPSENPDRGLATTA